MQHQNILLKNTNQVTQLINILHYLSFENLLLYTRSSWLNLAMPTHPPSIPTTLTSLLLYWLSRCSFNISSPFTPLGLYILAYKSFSLDVSKASPFASFRSLLKGHIFKKPSPNTLTLTISLFYLLHRTHHYLQLHYFLVDLPIAFSTKM